VRERHPAVAAALAATGSADAPRALLADTWTVRAGAIEGLRLRRERAAAALLVPRLESETGRLQDDLSDVLAWIAGGEQADWPKWLEGLAADWTPAAYPDDGKPPDPVLVTPCVSASGRQCFGLPTGSEALVLCVDAGPAWEAVQGEVSRFLGTLPERAEFGIVAFGAGATAFRKKLVAASGANRDAAAKWMEGLRIGSRADLYDGLQAAFDLADGGRNRAARADTIVLFAPQRPSEVGLSPTLVGNPRQIALELGRRNALLRLRVLAAGASGGGESYYLQQLARPHGGGFKPTGR
jgi:hypothetical protein